MDDRYPAFDDAVSRFRAFLTAQRWPPLVVWIRPGDTRFRRGRFVVRRVPVVMGEAHAREVYSRAVAGQRGVMLEAVCRAHDRTFARVVRPLDDDASARGLFPDGLKLAVPERPAPATVASGWLWPLVMAATSWPFHEPDFEA